MAPNRRRLMAFAAVITVGSTSLVAPTAFAEAPTPDASTSVPVDDLAVATDGGTVVAAAPSGASVAAPDAVVGASRSTIARAQVERTVRSLRLDVTTDSLRVAPTRAAVPADAPVRFRQWIDGLPVYGSSVVVSLNADGGLRSLIAATADDATLPSASVGAARAQQIARDEVAAKERGGADQYVASEPYALAYAPELLDESGDLTRAWRVYVSPKAGIGGHEVIVDAVDGNVLQVIERVERAQRGICDGANSYTGPAAYGWCGQSNGNPSVPYARSEGQAATGNAEVDAAYDALGDTTTFFANALGVNINSLVAPTDASIGRVGGVNRTLAGIVNYCDPVEAFGNVDLLARIFCPMPNAFWAGDESNWNPAIEPYPGGQMFIGQGFAGSVDVIAHEVSHGVTAATSNLIYEGEPGAINESMSDVFGQLVQLYADGAGDPLWDLGEDVAAPAHTPIPGAGDPIPAIDGPFRRMGAPSNFGQPAKMTDPLWDVDAEDQDFGGVHTNSGVGNFAAYLMSNGGTANGITVKALDAANSPSSQPAVTKLARLYWTTQGLLPSNANYRVLGLTLQTACTQLVGTYGFTGADCTDSVGQAIKATGMIKLTPSLTASASSLVFGGSVSLTGQLKDARGTAVKGASVRLEKLPAGTTTWYPVATSATTSAGKATWSIVPTRTTYYRLVTLTGGTASVTSSRKVTVLPVVSRSVSSTSLRLGQSFTVTGKVTPSRPGQSVRLERFYGGSWRWLGVTTLSSTSTYRFTVTPSARSTLTYRVVRPAEVAYGIAASNTFVVAVR